MEGNWHKCHLCKEPVHNRLFCKFVHEGEDDEHHVCDACHQVGKDQGQRAPSPGRMAAAQLLVNFGSPGHERDIAPSDKDVLDPVQRGKHVSMFARVAKVPLPEQAGNPPRVAAVHTPRPEYALLPPPAPGTTWSWQPEIIGADGADAGPNGIIQTVKQENPEYNPIRGHCSVHKKRNVQQNKTKIFEGAHHEKESKANALTTLMEQVKSHSITVALAQLGKRKITEHLNETDSAEAADYFRKQHQDDKWTLVEMNAGAASGGGVPCTTNSIERANRGQKEQINWRKSKVIPFMSTLRDQIGQRSMDDLEFGLSMPRGYKKNSDKKKGASTVIDKTVWSVSFFDQVKSEISHPAGVHRLVWKAKLPSCGYHADSLIMSSRKMRAWVLTDQAFAAMYSKADDKERSMRNAMSQNSVLDGKAQPSFVKQFQDIVRDAGTADVSLPDLIEWQQCFHILQPITCPIYVGDLLKRLSYSGLSLDEDVVRKVTAHLTAEDKGDQNTKPIYLYKCSCALYQHYAWCIHVMLRAVHIGLVPPPYCPPTMDNTLVSLPGQNPKQIKGRPSKSRKGGALAKED